MRPPASLDGLGCHLEHIRSTRCKLREGFVARGSEMLRFAQHDMVVHLSLTWLKLRDMIFLLNNGSVPGCIFLINYPRSQKVA